MAIVTGTSGDDQYPRELEGTNLADQIFGLGGNDTLEGGAGADQLFGSDGLDLASYKGSAAGVSVSLQPLNVAYGDAAGDQLYGIEGVVGSAFQDSLLGDDQRNVLRGGGGGDRFVYQQRYDSEPAAPDLIRDFSRAQGDRIDLRGVDADEQEGPADQAFQFVGQAQFTGVGQLRFYQAGGDTFVEANTDGVTADAEMTIKIDPLVKLQATDFLL